MYNFLVLPTVGVLTQDTFKYSDSVLFWGVRWDSGMRLQLENVLARYFPNQQFNMAVTLGYRLC